MDASFQNRRIEELKRKYRFKKIGKDWLREGECPNCRTGNKDAYCAADAPKIVTCNKSSSCGFRERVKDVLPELFADWSSRVQATPEDPNTLAEAYLRDGRGLSLEGLRGAFTQETYYDRNLDAGSATVRFQLPNGTWWERIIDKPGRFGKKKANIPYGAKIAGHAWAHPSDTLDVLAAMDEIWFTEGIFNALALRQNFGRLSRHGTRKTKATAVSAMSSNFWPEHFLADLRKAITDAGLKKQPKLIFAFDVGAAGVSFTKKFVLQAKDDGWQRVGAAQIKPETEGDGSDWNDLWLDQQDKRTEAGAEDKGPLSAKMIDEYLFNGSVICAKTAIDKARLIHNYKNFSSFHFRHNNQIYWCAAKKEDGDGSSDLNVEDIANCAPRLLYRERDEIKDETNYFAQIDFPFQKTEKARFSNSAISAPGEFHKRLLAFGGTWEGSPKQLTAYTKGQLRRLKTVTPIEATGYCADVNAWLLGDIAVRAGRVEKLNEDKYFDFGKHAVKLKSAERVLDIHYADSFSFAWVPDLWEAWGPRGLIALGFFTLSLFAVQIRKEQVSLGFLEVWGEANSGKTTLMIFLWKLLGRPNNFEGDNPNLMTKVALARSLIKVSGLPVGIIENQNDDKAEEKKFHGPSFDWNELLTLFTGGSPRATGMKTTGGEIHQPPFLASLYLMHNQPVNSTPQVMQRIMSMQISTKHWTATSGIAARRIEQYDAAAASGWIVHATKMAEQYLPFFFKRTDHHREEMLTRTPEVLNSRIRLNHSQLAAGVDALRGLIPKNILPDAWLDETIDFIDAMAVDREKVSAAEHPVIEKFWGLFDYLVAREADDAAWPVNLHRRGGEYIAINIPHFMAACRERGVQPPLEDQLKKHLKDSKTRKYLRQGGVNTRNGLGGMHCWIFENPDKTLI